MCSVCLQVEAFNKATDQMLQRNGERWVKDNDEYLYSLMQCNFNIEEALRRHSFNSVKPVSTTSLWTEQEVDKFENGMCTARTFSKFTKTSCRQSR
jgi:hypothetical protein